jgi:hypothetical protein
MAHAGHQVVNVRKNKKSHIVIIGGYKEDLTDVTSVIDPSGTYTFTPTAGNPGKKLMIRLECTATPLSLRSKGKPFDVVSTGDLTVTVTTSTNGAPGTQTIDVPVEFVDDSNG